MIDLPEKYDNQGNLGSGNFGTVYKGYNKNIGRIEAIKIISNISTLRDNGTIEARIQHKLKHDNVVEIHDAFIRNDKLYILMECLSGGSISDLMEKHKLTVKQSIKIAIDCLHGLQHIHNNNFIHRDIKPSNILLDSNNVAKLSDFGLTSELNQDGKYKCTFGYVNHLAPEVFKTNEFIVESDIFALGLTLYRMINGDDFIENFEKPSIPHYITNGSFPPRKSYSPDVPQRLIGIINKSLELNPDDRFLNAHSMRSELSKIKIPIDWNLRSKSVKREVWVGSGKNMNYEVEVSNNLLSKTYDVITRKGNIRLKCINKLCYYKLNLKEKDKILRRLLTSQLI